MSTMSASRTRKRTNVMIPDHVFGTLIFVFTELMFYSALLSAFLVMRRGRDTWGQADALLMPFSAEGFNGLVLALSALSVVLAQRAFSRQPAQARAHLLRATGLAFLFSAYQLVLAVRLFGSGVTLNSSVFGGSLYLIFGSHLLQALLGSLWMGKIVIDMGAGRPSVVGNLRGLTVFWCSLFAIWPAIYGVLFF